MTCHVLLVEDSDEDYLAYRRALTATELSVVLHRVSTGDEALEYLQRDAVSTHASHHMLPRLLFLDLNLPGISGLELLQVMRADESLKTMQVVVVTSSCAPGERSQCDALGVAAYIVKNLDFDTFKHDILHCLLRFC